MAAPNFANRTLYHGDNLAVLRGMNSGTVQLIATDPPFNKNRDFHSTPDSLAAGAGFQDRWSWERDVHQTAPPVRTDNAEPAAPNIKVKVSFPEPPGPKLSREEIFNILIEQYGIVCQGCDRKFDDPLYLELDHNTPRSDGGLNHISNRCLLCSPCNRIKSNTLKLSGLRRENRRRGRMAGQMAAAAG